MSAIDPGTAFAAEGRAAVEAIRALVSFAAVVPPAYDARPSLRTEGNKILDAVGELCDLVDRLDQAARR